MVEPGHQQHHREAPQHHQADCPVCPGHARATRQARDQQYPQRADRHAREQAQVGVGRHEVGALRATWRARPVGQPTTWALHASQTRGPNTARLISENQSSARSRHRGAGWPRHPPRAGRVRAPADQACLRKVVDRQQPGQREHAACQRQQDRQSARLPATAPQAPTGQRPAPHEPGAELSQPRGSSAARSRPAEPLAIRCAATGPGVRVAAVQRQRQSAAIVMAAQAQTEQQCAAGARAAAVGAEQHRQRQQHGALIHRPPKPAAKGQAAAHACRLQAASERPPGQLREAGQGEREHGEASRGCVSCACRTEPSVPRPSSAAGVRALHREAPLPRASRQIARPRRTRSPGRPRHARAERQR